VTFARRALGLAKWGVSALCVVVLVRTLGSDDLALTSRILSASGPWVLLAALPFALAQAFDAEAWRLVLARLAPAVRLRELYPLRVAMEAMTVSLPAGVVVAESVAPRLLERTLGIPASATVAAAAARRWLTMRAHAIYVAVGAAAGLVVVHERAGALESLRYAPFVVLGSALLPLFASLAVSSVLSSGSRAAAVGSTLLRLPIPALRTWVTQRRHAFAATDA
jgi:uncharacterized membrane protein YbhN (UPF0104 family)